MHAYHHIRLGKTSAKVKNSFDELLPDPWLKAEDGIFRFRSYMQAGPDVKSILICAQWVSFFKRKN